MRMIPPMSIVGVIIPQRVPKESAMIPDSGGNIVIPIPQNPASKAEAAPAFSGWKAIPQDRIKGHRGEYPIPIIKRVHHSIHPLGTIERRSKEIVTREHERKTSRTLLIRSER